MSTSLRITAAGALATVLTSFALIPATEGRTWVLSGVVMAVVVALLGWALRLLRTPSPVVPLVQVVAATWVLLLLFADGLWLGVAPSPAAFGSLADRLAGGAEVINQYAAPLQSDDDVAVVITLGVALIAFTVDLLASTLRLVPWAGLPLLLLYSIPATTVPDGLSPWAFIATAVGYVLLLMSEGRSRLAGWGQIAGYRDSADARPEVSTSVLGKTGRRVGAVVICLAVVVPWLLPALPESMLQPDQTSGLGSGSGTGGRMISVKNPVLDLRRNLRLPENVEVMKFRSDNPQPDYVRTAVLDEYTGRLWKPSDGRVPKEQQVSKQVPTPGLGDDVGRTRVSTEFEVSRALRSERLPVPLTTTRAEIQGDWRYDADNQNVIAGQDGTTTAGLRYTTDSLRLDLDPATLSEVGPAPAAMSEYTALPTDLPDQVRDQAFDVAGTETNDYARAVALQEWFRTDFAYSTAVEDGHDEDAIVGFLNDRSGYCEQFAATMAIMARVLDIPARVGIGYMPGDQSGEDRWVVRAQNAHAWPELYFDGYGWIRFEPTPAQQTGAAPPWTDNLPENTPDPTSSAGELPTGPTEDSQDPSRGEQPSPTPTDDASDKAGAGGGRFPIDPGALAAGAAVIVLLGTPAAARALVRRRRLRDQGAPGRTAEGAWRELADTMTDHGLSWDDSSTPRTAARTLVARLPAAAHDAVRTITGAVERYRYAPDPGAGVDLAEPVRTVRVAIAASVSWPRRLLGRCLPPSVLRRLSAIGRPFTWTAERMDGLGARAIRRFRRRTTG